MMSGWREKVLLKKVLYLVLKSHMGPQGIRVCNINVYSLWRVSMEWKLYLADFQLREKKKNNRESKYSFFNLISIFCTSRSLLHTTDLKTYTLIFFPMSGYYLWISVSYAAQNKLLVKITGLRTKEEIMRDVKQKETICVGIFGETQRTRSVIHNIFL